jgi:hypothetical protein
MIDEGVAKLRVRRFSGLFWPIFRFFSGGNRPLANLSFCRFWGSFEPIFDSFCGGCINFRIQPPQKESKIGQNNPQNRRSLSYARGLIYAMLILPPEKNGKSAQKNPKIDRT